MEHPRRSIDERALVDFVEYLISKGRTPLQIKHIASSTRWKPLADRAYRQAKHLKRFLKKNKKRSKIGNQAIDNRVERIIKNNNTRRSEMIISKKEAVELFMSLGYVTANRWDDQKLLTKIRRLDEDTEGDLDEEQQSLLADILVTLEEDNNIEITPDGNVPKKVSKKAAKKVSKKVESKAPEKAVKKVTKKASEKAVKKAAKKPEKKAVKKAVKKKSDQKEEGKKHTRWTACLAILQKRKRHTRVQVIEESNALYMKEGGRDDMNEASRLLKLIIVVLSFYNVLEVKDKKIIML